MSTVNIEKRFDQYYQSEYDFNTTSLPRETVDEIKKLAREIRVDYGLAPMGTGIFGWILNQNNSIRFEMVSFDSEKIDGMLYIPRMGHERAYIVLNANKPLVNQIFTTAHEYYHYIKDYQSFRQTPYICDRSQLKDTNEKCACRFAAELLLPDEALKKEIDIYLRRSGAEDIKEVSFSDCAGFIMLLTIIYELPLKAVIYRLVEEGYIDNENQYIKEYDFIKRVLRKTKVLQDCVRELYGKENIYVTQFNSIYDNMEKAYLTGNASEEEILRDAKRLELDQGMVDDIFRYDEHDELGDQDEIANDEELFQIINEKWRENANGHTASKDPLT